MRIHRLAALAAVLTLAAGAAHAQEGPTRGLDGCTLPAAPAPEQPCHHQMARLGLDGVEPVTDMQLPATESPRVATFDLHGVVVLLPGERVAVALPGAATDVAAGEASPTPDVEATGSVGPGDAAQ